MKIRVLFGWLLVDNSKQVITNLQKRPLKVHENEAAAIKWQSHCD